MATTERRALLSRVLVGASAVLAAALVGSFASGMTHDYGAVLSGGLWQVVMICVLCVTSALGALAALVRRRGRRCGRRAGVCRGPTGRAGRLCRQHACRHGGDPGHGTTRCLAVRQPPAGHHDRLTVDVAVPLSVTDDQTYVADHLEPLGYTAEEDGTWHRSGLVVSVEADRPDRAGEGVPALLPRRLRLTDGLREGTGSPCPAR